MGKHGAVALKVVLALVASWSIVAPPTVYSTDNPDELPIPLCDKPLPRTLAKFVLGSLEDKVLPRLQQGAVDWLESHHPYLADADFTMKFQQHGPGASGRPTLYRCDENFLSAYPDTAAGCAFSAYFRLSTNGKIREARSLTKIGQWCKLGLTCFRLEPSRIRDYHVLHSGGSWDKYVDLVFRESKLVYVNLYGVANDYMKEALRHVNEDFQKCGKDFTLANATRGRVFTDGESILIFA